jgi:hypothetical protein
MKTEIDTYSAVLKSFNYLENELKRMNLNKVEAILYFQILLEEEENDIIERPHFTFILDDYEKYLAFFKKYNFINSGFNRNTFRLSKNWKDNSVKYAIPLALENDFLQALNKHEELKNYLRFSA